MTGHHAKAERGRDGHVRWRSVCPECPWTSTLPHSRQSAEKAAVDHNHVTAAIAAAEQLRCDCWHPDEVEMFPVADCPRCSVLNELRAVA